MPSTACIVPLPSVATSVPLVRQYSMMAWRPAACVAALPPKGPSGKPVAKLPPLKVSTSRYKSGGAKGKFRVEFVDHLPRKAAVPETLVVDQCEDFDGPVLGWNGLRNARWSAIPHVRGRVPLAAIDGLCLDELLEERPGFGVVAEAGVDVGQIDVEARIGIRPIRACRMNAESRFQSPPR